MTMDTAVNNFLLHKRTLKRVEKIIFIMDDMTQVLKSSSTFC